MEPRDCKWRDVSPDYYGRLQQFECAKGELHETLGTTRKHGKYYRDWELEVQSTIRSFHKPNPAREWAQICVSASDGTKLDKIYSFVWFGIVNGTKSDSGGSYLIGYIARALDTYDCHFGDFTLKHALKVLSGDQMLTGRQQIISARIDPRNDASMRLFERNGFEDFGTDETQPAYHRWIRFGFRGV
jgi:hypothetical protein